MCTDLGTVFKLVARRNGWEKKGAEGGGGVELSQRLSEMSFARWTEEDGAVHALHSFTESMEMRSACCETRGGSKVRISGAVNA